MKKKKTLQKGVISAVVVSIFASSCNADYTEYNQEDSVYKNLLVSSNPDVGAQLLNIRELNLTNEVQNYASIMHTLMKDITTDVNSAKLFCSNPDAYLSQTKFSQTLNIDLSQYLTDQDKMVLLALTDEDVQRAAKQNNLSDFIRLCKSKGLLSDPATIVSKCNVDYSHFFETEEDYQLFKGKMSSLRSVDNMNEAFVAYIGVLVGARVGAYADDYVFDRTEFWGVSNHENIVTKNIISAETTLRLWTNEHVGTVIESEKLFDAMVIQRAEEVASAIVENYPEYDKEKIKEFLVLNLQTFYNIK